MTIAGPTNGLSLELFTGSQEQTLYSYKKGFRVVVHNQSTEPILNKQGIDVSAKQLTNIAISRTFYENLSTPSRQCITVFDQKYSLKNSLLKTLYNELNIRNIEEYSTDLCINICNQLYLVEKCRCYDYENPKVGNVTDNDGCIFINMTCYKKVNEKFFESEINNCYKNCPLKCNSVKYDLSISTANYPTQW
jgi:hypothetical protein